MESQEHSSDAYKADLTPGIIQFQDVLFAKSNTETDLEHKFINIEKIDSILIFNQSDLFSVWLFSLAKCEKWCILFFNYHQGVLTCRSQKCSNKQTKSGMRRTAAITGAVWSVFPQQKEAILVSSAIRWKTVTELIRNLVFHDIMPEHDHPCVLNEEDIDLSDSGKERLISRHMKRSPSPPQNISF